MGWLNKPNKPAAVEAVAAVYVPTPGDRFEGSDIIFRDGFYYPVIKDDLGAETGPNVDMPLVWVADENEHGGGHHEHAAPDAPSHFHTYGLNPVELTPEPD